MCTNGGNSHFIDARMYLFHLEYHARDAVTDLIVHYYSTSNTALNRLEIGACADHIIG